MTISSSTRRAGPFAGNGVTVAFPFTFKVFTTADVLVVQAVTATGVESTQTLGTNYTVSLNADQNANPGGTITMLVAPPVGYTLTATSQVGNLQPMDLTNAGGFYPKVLNDAMDRTTVQIQQLSEGLSRAVKVPISSAVQPTEYLSVITALEASATASKNSAVVSEANALASLNDFKGRYYGALAANPTLDPLGNAPTLGDEYFNTTNNVKMVYRSTGWLSYEVDAAASAATALSGKNAAAVSETNAGVSAGLAVTSKIAAEAARDAAIIGAGVYATEALGRSAVADGVAFKVQGSGDVAAYEYRRTNSTTSVLIATYPSASLVSLGIKSFKPSPNLFNYRTVIAGMINQGNNYYGVNAAYGSSVRIPVVPGEVYYLTYGDTPVVDPTIVYAVAVSPTMADNPITCIPAVAGAYTIPAGNYFLSISALIGRITDPALKWQLTKTTQPTRFYDAGFSIDPAYSAAYPLVVSYAAMKNELDKVTTMPALAGVSEGQTSYLKLGKNTYSNSLVNWGYSIYTSTGALQASGIGWAATDYIPVTPSVANFVSTGYHREGAYIPSFFSSYYDVNKVFITSTVPAVTDSVTGLPTITPPAGAVFVRFSTTIGAVQTEASAYLTFASLMVSVGYAPYEPYGYIANNTTSKFRDEVARTYLKPFNGKGAAFLGDSITMQGRYFVGIYDTTGIDYINSVKNLGQNGAVLRTVADALTPEMLTNVDVVTVLAGTNDYGHGGYGLGSITDTKDSLTFHGCVYYVIDKILTAKSTVRIVFFTPIQRGVFGAEPNPYATGYPNGDAPGSAMLTMPAISKAIVDVCRMRGIACLDLFGASGCNDKTFLNYFPSNDLLHPHDAGAYKLGSQMGRFINSLV